MPNNIINRERAEALIQEQVVSTIFQDAPQNSTFMSLARKLPNMTSKQTRIPVLDMLPMAYWVNGDTGFKQTSAQAWDNVYLTAAELAVIIPIPEAVIDDADFDIMGEITPRVNEAIGRAVDSAVIFGINRPSEWQNDIITMARQAGNNVSVSGGITYDALLGANGVISKVEQAGSAITGGIASMAMRGALRSIKDSNGAPLYNSNMQGATQYALDGAPLYFPKNGAFDPSVAQLVVGDFSQAVYAIRQDVTVKILDQGVIQNPVSKEIMYNLAQQDMVALRVVFRMGWALPNPATALNGDRTLVPFAYLEPVSPKTTYTATITVEDGSGSPVAGAMVNLGGSRIKANGSGVAVFNLFDGDYAVKATKAGYRSGTANVTVSGGAATATVVVIEE